MENNRGANFLMRHKIILLLYLISSSCNAFCQLDTKERYYIQYSIPPELNEILEQSSSKRKVYQNDEGVMFAFSRSAKVSSQKQVELIASLSLYELAESLIGFELLHEDRNIIVYDLQYCLFVYTHGIDDEKVRCYSYHTNIGGEFVTFLFCCPEYLDDKWRDVFGEIIVSVRYILK